MICARVEDRVEQGSQLTQSGCRRWAGGREAVRVRGCEGAGAGEVRRRAPPPVKIIGPRTSPPPAPALPRRRRRRRRRSNRSPAARFTHSCIYKRYSKRTIRGRIQLFTRLSALTSSGALNGQESGS